MNNLINLYATNEGFAAAVGDLAKPFMDGGEGDVGRWLLSHPDGGFDAETDMNSIIDEVNKHIVSADGGDVVTAPLGDFVEWLNRVRECAGREHDANCPAALFAGKLNELGDGEVDVAGMAAQIDSMGSYIEKVEGELAHLREHGHSHDHVHEDDRECAHDEKTRLEGRVHELEGELESAHAELRAMSERLSALSANVGRGRGKRACPKGVVWPRFSDGKLVKLGADVRSALHRREVVGSMLFTEGGVEVGFESGAAQFYKPGEAVEPYDSVTKFGDELDKCDYRYWLSFLESYNVGGFGTGEMFVGRDAPITCDKDIATVVADILPRLDAGVSEISVLNWKPV